MQRCIARAGLVHCAAIVPNSVTTNLKVLSQEQHGISKRHISKAALSVISQLHKHHHQAYLVGGAVRDLMLGQRPKDFDIATDATPEQVHKLFRGARIIGRRFRIVHVRFGREIIEVTTFRGHHDDNKNKGKDQSRQSATGRLLRDNVYGTLEEDVVRRDLTINALYYDPESNTVHDQVDGLSDLRAKKIRIIGDPETRYREDPVRMLRVLRFAAKLGFKPSKSTAEPIDHCARLLADIPPARLFDEFVKLFMSGHASNSLKQLQKADVFKYLFPETCSFLADSPLWQSMLDTAMQNTDARIAAKKPVTPAFLLAVILWPAVKQQQAQLKQLGEPAVPAMHSAGSQVVMRCAQTLSIPRRFSQPMREIWDFQIRLNRRKGRKAAELVDHKRFRAAYDFLLLREQAGEDIGDLGAFWTHFQTLPMDERLTKTGTGKRPRKRNSKNKTASDND